MLRKYTPSVVFSLNFFPSVSLACQEMKVKYISWIYDNPQTAAYDECACSDNNFIFSYDSYMVRQLHERGVPHVYYMPMAVNDNRLKQMHISHEDELKYICDIAFVGSLYNENTDYYSYMVAKADNEYFTGYLEGLLNSQKLVYGYNFTSEALSPEIMEQFGKVGGFLMSNYQEDFLRHFEPEKHMVMYGSIYEAIDKCDYYLGHDEERNTIKKMHMISC